MLFPSFFLSLTLLLRVQRKRTIGIFRYKAFPTLVGKINLFNLSSTKPNFILSEFAAFTGLNTLFVGNVTIKFLVFFFYLVRFTLPWVFHSESTPVVMTVVQPFVLTLSNTVMSALLILLHL